MRILADQRKRRLGIAVRPRSLGYGDLACDEPVGGVRVAGQRRIAVARFGVRAALFGVLCDPVSAGKDARVVRRDPGKLREDRKRFRVPPFRKKRFRLLLAGCVQQVLRFVIGTRLLKIPNGAFGIAFFHRAASEPQTDRRVQERSRHAE